MHNPTPTLLTLLFSDQADTAARHATPQLLEWSALFDDWLNTRFALSTYYGRRAIRHWRQFIALAHKPPFEAAEADVRAFVAHLQESGLTPLHQHLALVDLSTFYQFAASRLPPDQVVDPTHRIERLAPTALRQTFYLDFEQAKALLAAVQSEPSIPALRDYAMLLAALTSPLRSPEIRALRWGDLEIDSLTGQAWAQPQASLSARCRPRPSAELPPASHPPFRCRLEPDLVQAILAWLQASGRLDQIAPADYVFTPRRMAWSSLPLDQASSWNRHRTINHPAFYAALEKYARQANLNHAQVTWHTLHNTAICLRLEAGDSFDEIFANFGYHSLAAAKTQVKRLLRHATQVEWRKEPAPSPNDFYAPALPAEDLERLDRLNPAGLAGEVNALRVVMFHNLRHALSSQDPAGLLRILDTYSSAVARLAQSLRVQHELEGGSSGAPEWTEIAENLLKDAGWEDLPR